jgi:hypothetical protein
LNTSRFLGRWLNLFSIIVNASSLTVSMHRLLGMYWRSKPLSSRCCRAAYCNTDRQIRSGAKDLIDGQVFGKLLPFFSPSKFSPLSSSD